MLAAILFLLTMAAADPRPGPFPQRGYACPRTGTPITVDGRLDEAAWQAAPWTDAFVDIEATRAVPPRYRTRARMLWDDTYFYVAAEMQEPHLWATLRERDSVIYHDNDFEVFLDPDGDSHLYTEIELNALNTVWDLLLVKPYRDGGPALHAWDIPGLQTAVALEGTLNDPSDEDRGWSVEIAIPFAVLKETTQAACPPNVGDRWRVNFSRVQWRLDIDSATYTKRDAPEDNWVWSPQREIAMHEPEHWGIVEFVEEPTGHDVAPTTAQAVEWHLRYASYQLAQQREALGAWPLAFTYAPPNSASDTPAGSLASKVLAGAIGSPAPETGSTDVPALPAGCIGPTYWSDGSRYTLRIHLGDMEFSLTEDGRFTSSSPSASPE